MHQGSENGAIPIAELVDLSVLNLVVVVVAAVEITRTRTVERAPQDRRHIAVPPD